MNTHSYLHPVRIGLNLLRIASILFLLLSAFGPAYVTPVYADKLVCGIPGRDGPATLSGIVNTYYPGTADVAAGSTSIPVGGASGGGPAIAAGDLLLVIQMQGADINSTNTDAYGDGVAGGAASGSLAANRTAGQYEYVVATSGVAGGFVSISSGLVNSYDFENFGTQGQRRFQVIRVPQNSSATISGTVSALPWNGSVGGVVAIDVAGTLTFGGGAVDVSEQGFRGGGGVRYTGTTGLTNTDVRTLSSSAANGSKGEGIAGTPRFIFNGSSVVDLGLEGYPNGTNARGAPGNAGGGSTDGNPTQNDENSGGGGGGNGGAGGLGGNTWRSNLSRGGYGGSPFAANATHLVLGGGGGAGSINNQNNPVLSSGGAGGGIVMIRAGTVAGIGTINANGADGQDQPANESGGGGGAGGSVLVVAQNPLPAGLNVSANGGDGGDAWPTQPEITDQNWRHGPGGGGGGGVVFLSSPVSTITVAGGQHGLTTLSNDTYGSVDGSPGVTGTSTTAASLTTGISGAECIPSPTVVKTTSTPVVTQTPTGTTGTYTINVSIPANQGTALGVTINDTLPTGFTYASTTLPIGLAGGATRVSVADPGVGTTTPSWGTFQIPGGGSVQITFTVNIASTVAPGVYDNPANATYLDPTRTTPNGETISEYDHIPNDGEDIEVLGTTALSDLTVTKVNDAGGSVQPGSSFNWTIEVSNLGPGAVAFTGGNVIMSDALPGVAGYYPQGAVTVTNGPTPPSSTPTCTITGTALSCVANGTTTLPVNGSFSVTFAVTPTAGGDLTNTAVVDPNGIITETNEGNNTATNTVSVLGADLSIVKTDGQTSYAAGSVVTYTVTVTNLGGANITGATVSDARPANVSTWAWACTSVTNGAANCTPAANSAADFSDTVDLPVSGTIVYTVTANIVASPTGDLVNTATVAVPAGYVDTNTGNNSSTDTDTLTATTADLAIDKDDGQTGYAAGGTVTYTVTVENLSGSDVTGAIVSDPRPTNVSTWAWACTSENNGATGCTAAGSSANDFSDTVNLPVGGSIVYTVTANIVANPTGDLVNTATVTPPTGVSDPNTGNNSSTDTDSLLSADLAITKDDGQVSYLGGDTLTYTVTVVNLSQTVDVAGATVSDAIPSNIASWTWACTGGTGSGCTPAGSSSSNFTDTVDLPAGATIVYTVTAIAVANPTGNLVNTATVDGPPGFTDADPTNNTSTDTDVLGPASDLSLSKSVSNSAPAVGSNITFTITATNIGPDPATGVEVTENLPSGFTFVSAAPSAGTTYNSATGLWTIGNMAVNETVTLTLTVTVNPTGSYVNTAEISASLLIDPDSTPGNGVPAEDDQGTVTVVPDFGGGGGGGGGGGNNPPSNPTTPVVTGFLIPVTGFAPNKVTPLNVAAKPDYTSTDLRIEIPTVRVSTSIVGVGFKDGNWDVSWLQDEAGWLSGTAYPTWSGNSVLTAHAVNKDGKPGMFSNLKNLARGEYVFVYTDGYRYTYQVVSNQLLQPTDPSVLKHEEKSFITLITCDTYDEGSGNYLLRTVVRAKLVDVSAVQ